MSLSLATTSSRLAEGLRRLREERGLSISALGRRSGLSKTSVSNVEAGKANPSLETLVRLSEALNVGLSALLGADAIAKPKVIRPDEGERFESLAGLRGRLLMPLGRAHTTELLEIDLEAGADYSAGAHPQGTEEFLVGVKGALRVEVGGKVVDLEEGSALWFSADVPHRYASLEGARVLVLMSYASPQPGVTLATGA